MTHRRYSRFATACCASLFVFLAACEGDDGAAGPAGPGGPAGPSGGDALVSQTTLPPGSAACPTGGVRIDSGTDTDGDGALGADEITDTSYVCHPSLAKNFYRVASFPVCLQLDPTCNDGTGTAAEIVAASEDGTTLIYTDSPAGLVGFVDILDPSNPAALGTLATGGEPTSVAVIDAYALVGVNTSADFVNVSGELQVIDIATQALVATVTLSGQPDSVAVSPDGNWAAIVIENERDEDLGDGAPPQAPPGALDVVALAGAPATWVATTVSLVGVPDLYPGDPEPEYVDINDNNVAVVTLQENNHIVLVDLPTGTIINDFSAGSVDLDQVDATEEDPAVISQTEALTGVPREPDGVAWINNSVFATADEGDLDGGSRGFTVFNTAGDVLYTSGNELEHATARLGHYPEARSANKGNEPENVEFGVYGGDNYLFVASERSSLVFVYDLTDPVNPRLRQALPAGLGPEGVLAIPSRNLLVAASEEDSRGDGFRSVLNVYAYDVTLPKYPSIQSADRPDGTPIPWAALSGLAASNAAPNLLYAIEDSFYGSNRIFAIDIDKFPAELASEISITDANDVFAAIPAAVLADPNVDDDDATRIDVFDEADLAALINADGSVNIDPEGIAVASDGGFWVASEGAGTVGDAGQPVNSLNFLFKTDAAGVIEDVVLLPDALNAAQLRFGYEGVAEYDGDVYVAFQRAWPGDTDVRIGIYDVAGDAWSFLYYPLDAPASQNGGWVGLSDLVALGTGEFLVVERDNQAGPDAAIKRIYSFDVTGLAADSVVTKTLVLDLMPTLMDVTNGPITEKIEGLAVSAMGDAWIVNDNDGVDDSNGETNLINLGDIL